jgi:phosphoglycolate phosphatase
VDSSRDLASAVNEALRRVAPGTPPLSLEEVRALIGEGARLLVARALERRGLPQPAGDVLPVFLDCYAGRLLETTRPYPGIPEALDALAPRALAVLTNKPGDMSRTILEGLGLAGRFRRVYGAGDLPARKPDPEGLRRLLAEAGVAAEDAVMVGDSAIDVRTARAAGVRALGVAWGFDPQSLRREPPDAIVSRPSELPAAL